MSNETVVLPSGEKAKGLSLDQAAATLKVTGGEDASEKEMDLYLDSLESSEPSDESDSDEPVSKKELTVDQAADEFKTRLAPKEEPEPEPETDDKDEIPAPQPHPARREITEAAATWQQEFERFNQAVNRINWQELQQTNPGEFAALRQEYTEWRDQLHTRAEAIRQVNQKVSTEEQGQYYEHAHKVISKDIPEWRNPEKRAKVQKALADTARKMGYSDQEINQLYDPRAVKALYQIWKAENPDKKVPKIPLKMKGKKSAPEASLQREIGKRNARPGSLNHAALELKHMLRNRGV